MIRFPRLRYSQTYPFSLKATVLGEFAIFAAVAAAVLATVLTKGRVNSTEILYLENFNHSGFVCNSTLIYPGQPFGGLGTNSTFAYITQNSFAYGGQNMSECVIQPGATITFSAVAPWNQGITFGYTVECVIDASSNATFAVTRLNLDLGSTPLGSPAQGIWGNALKAWGDDTMAAFKGSGGMSTVNTSNLVLQSMRIDVDLQWVSSYWQNHELTIDLMSNTTYQYARLLLDTVEAGILADFDSSTGGASLTSNVLYPCTSARKDWASKWTILWECYTSATATLSPVVAIVTWILVRMTANSPLAGDSASAQCPQCSSPPRNTRQVLDEKATKTLHSRDHSPTSSRNSSGFGYVMPELEWKKELIL